MTEGLRSIDEVTEALADGKAIDWSEVREGSGSDGRLEGLKLLDEVRRVGVRRRCVLVLRHRPGRLS